MFKHKKCSVGIYFPAQDLTFQGFSVQASIKKWPLPFNDQAEYRQKKNLLGTP